jgi:exodeoxyribonuclease V gamma subunit
VLHIHRAERADALVAALGALLADPLPDPFAAEVISVHSRGMERWLAQQLSGRLGTSADRRDGVCANVAFPSPRGLVAEVVAAACGIKPEEDPWLPERALWPLLEVVDSCLGELWVAPLSAHLAGPGGDYDAGRAGRRLSIVRHLVELFDRYCLDRPETVCSWARGEDVGPPLAGRAWQAELWRRLREQIALPGPAERLHGACARLREDPSMIDLPTRVSLFGLTRLPAAHAQVLAAVAASRDVHLFLLHPSAALWHKVAETTAHASPITMRARDPTGELPRNGLLRSWGRDAREMQIVLGASGEHTDHHHPGGRKAETLLARLQADVRADRDPPGAPAHGQPDARPPLSGDDETVRVHACHGRARQVDVLRDAILHLLAEDPGLEPRDIVVMCPDIETFAPLIQATFGAGETHADEHDVEGDARAAGPPDLRVRLADRSLRQSNPLLGAIAQLLGLADGRLTASQVLDLADREPVRRRFGFDDEDLGRLQEWVAQSGIRWGLDAEHRAPFKLTALPSGTWRAGLERVLLGVTMTEDGHRRFAEVLPLDDVESGVIGLAGRFAELIARLAACVDAFSTPKAIDAWAHAIGAAADALTASKARDSWQRAQLQRILDDLLAEATAATTSATSELALAEVRALIAERLAGRPTRANFRTGHLTICTLVPMRSVPHRVVCLLGLDDGAFPRKAPHDGDDLTLDDPHVGERDPRSEDRQLLLDALMAAGDRLIVTYTGNDERTNALRPPAVPVGELLDVIDATVRREEGLAREQVLVRHPLQPFDVRNFTPGALVRDRPWSFDAVMLEGGRALSGPRRPPETFLPTPLPALTSSVVEVEDLVRFVEHPVRAFLRRRLGIGVRDYSEELADGLPVELHGLERWGVGDRLLRARLAGVDGRTAALAEIARGTLPPGVLGLPVIAELSPLVEAILREADALTTDDRDPCSIDVRVELADGRALTGTVPGVKGDLLLATTFSRVAAKHRLAAWVRLLALTAAHPDRGLSAATVGRGQGAGVAVARLLPLAADAAARRETALEQLATLLDLFDRGMREPLPLFCATSAAYARAAVAGHDPAAAAVKAWGSGYRFDGEDAEPEHELVLGGRRGLDELLAEPARADEQGPGWAIQEPTRLGRLARRLCDGLLANEELIER